MSNTLRSRLLVTDATAAFVSGDMASDASAGTVHWTASLESEGMISGRAGLGDRDPGRRPRPDR